MQKMPQVPFVKTLEAALYGLLLLLRLLLVLLRQLLLLVLKLARGCSTEQLMAAG